MSFNPKQRPIGRFADEQFVPQRTINFLICEKILQFDWICQADRLKPVSGLPMPEDNPMADFFCVEKLTASHRLGKLASRL